MNLRPLHWKHRILTTGAWGKSQSFISKIDILVRWEDRHYSSQYRGRFVMEKSGFVLLWLYFSCCSVSIDIFRLHSRRAGCAALLEVGKWRVCVCVCVCVCGSGAENLISNFSAPNSAALPRGDWLPWPGLGWATGGVTAVSRPPALVSKWDPPQGSQAAAYCQSLWSHSLQISGLQLLHMGH